MNFLKPLLLFLALFLLLAYFFGSDETTSFDTNDAISRSPGMVPAVFDKLLCHESRSRYGTSRSTYCRVRYSYTVDGATYAFTTTSTDRAGAERYLAENAQIMYDTTQPRVATLKRYYDLRGTHGTRSETMVVVALLALILALPVSLFLSWRWGWFRRK